MNNELSNTFYKMVGRVYDIEDQLVRKIPMLMDHATDPDLREALNDHLKETEEQRSRLDSILKNQGGSVNTERDEAFEVMLADTERNLTEITDTSVRDAYIIAQSQTVEHLEMAKYGTLIAWAHEMGDSETEDTLTSSLEEEKAADKKLMSIAEGGVLSAGINREAAGYKQHIDLEI